MILVTEVGIYLFSEPFVCFGILFWPNLLLEEGKKDGDHQACFQCLTEDDEEDGDGEHVGHFDG